jgi:hypothetical protein
MRTAIVLTVLAVFLAASSASASVFLYEGFEAPPVGWNAYGQINGVWGPSLWHAETYRSAVGSYSAAYNTGSPNYNYDVGTSWGLLSSPWVDLSSAAHVQLDFYSWLQTEDMPYVFDLSFLVLKGMGSSWIPYPIDFQMAPQSQWNHFSINLAPLAGVAVPIKIGFLFDSVDEEFNDYEGWYIDDVVLHDQCPPPIPEPSTWLLLSTGLLGVGATLRRRLRG